MSVPASPQLIGGTSRITTCSVAGLACAISTMALVIAATSCCFCCGDRPSNISIVTTATDVPPWFTASTCYPRATLGMPAELLGNGAGRGHDARDHVLHV